MFFCLTKDYTTTLAVLSKNFLSFFHFCILAQKIYIQFVQLVHLRFRFEIETQLCYNFETKFQLCKKLLIVIAKSVFFCIFLFRVVVILPFQNGVYSKPQIEIFFNRYSDFDLFICSYNRFIKMSFTSPPLTILCML